MSSQIGTVNIINKYSKKLYIVYTLVQNNKSQGWPTRELRIDMFE